MREFIDCCAATAAWLMLCQGNHQLDTPTARQLHRGGIGINGSAWVLARTMALSIELNTLELMRRHRDQRILVNGVN